MEHKAEQRVAEPTGSSTRSSDPLREILRQCQKLRRELADPEQRCIPLADAPEWIRELHNSIRELGGAPPELPELAQRKDWLIRVFRKGEDITDLLDAAHAAIDDVVRWCEQEAEKTAHVTNRTDGGLTVVPDRSKAPSAGRLSATGIDERKLTDEVLLTLRIIRDHGPLKKQALAVALGDGTKEISGAFNRRIKWLTEKRLILSGGKGRGSMGYTITEHGCDVLEDYDRQNSAQ